MAEVDLTKLTKLEALKQLAERVRDGYVVNEDFEVVKGKVTKLESDVSGLQDQVDALETASDDYAKSTEVERDYLKKTEAASTYLTQTNAASTYATKADISAVYKPGGNKASVEELGTPSADNLGFVYNMTAEFITDNKFVEESGNKYPAGTNVVVIDAGSEDYKYDVLAGFIDLTDYAKSADVVQKETGKVLSSNDYTNEEKAKLAGIVIASDDDVKSMLDEVLGVPED